MLEVITIGFKICCKSFKNGVWRSWAWTCDNNVPSHSIFQYKHALLVLSTQIRSAPRPKPVAIGPRPLLRPSRHVPSCVPWIVQASSSWLLTKKFLAFKYRYFCKLGRRICTTEQPQRVVQKKFLVCVKSYWVLYLLAPQTDQLMKSKHASSRP